MHPGVGRDETQATDSDWRVRRTDYEFLTSREAQELLEEAGIVVIDYKAIQETWTQTGTGATTSYR